MGEEKLDTLETEIDDEVENQIDASTDDNAEQSLEENVEPDEHDKDEKKKSKLFSRKSKNDRMTEKLSEEIKDLQIKLDDTNAKLAESQDKFLRLFSEFDNYRKRTAKEKLDLTLTANEELISRLLMVLDDIDRATAADEADELDVEALVQGHKLIFDKFKNILKSSGLEEIVSTGTEFNTDEHEAIANMPAQSDEQKNKVIDTTTKGYRLNGKVIRHAKVVVGN